jgi:hypothetical protein
MGMKASLNLPLPCRITGFMDDQGWTDHRPFCRSKLGEGDQGRLGRKVGPFCCRASDTGYPTASGPYLDQGGAMGSPKRLRDGLRRLVAVQP